MSGVGTAFLYSLVETTETSEEKLLQALRAGFNEDYFMDEEDRNVWRFVHGYYLRYRQTPSIDVVEVELDFRFGSFPPEEPFQYWLEQLRAFNKHVYMVDVLERGYGLLEGGRTEAAESLLEDAVAGIRQFNPQDNVHTLIELANQVLEDHEQIQHGTRTPGIMTGIPYIDLVTGGAQPGDEWVIAGRPGSGKSFVVTRMAQGAWEARHRVLIISMEMGAIQFGRRNSAMGAAVNSKFLRLGRLSPFGFQRLQRHVQGITLACEDPTSFSVVEGRLNMSVKDILYAIRQYRPDIVFVDGAYMVKPAGGAYKSNWENALVVTNELKQMAQNEQVPVITTHQFNRRGEKEKTLGTIAYTDAIGQVASVVIALANDDVSSSVYRNHEFKTLELLKGREGEKGIVRMLFDTNRTQIEQDEVVEGDADLYNDEDDDGVEDIYGGSGSLDPEDRDPEIDIYGDEDGNSDC